MGPRHETMSRRALLRRGLTTTAAAALIDSPLAPPPGTDEVNLLASLKGGHPRLIASAGVWDTLTSRRKTDTLLSAFLTRGATEARALLSVAPVPYGKRGSNMLSVSRSALRRILLLALHARLADDDALVRRAEQEMLAVSAFPDWNPGHFLDTAEMTTALALGYDWLYDLLSEKKRQSIVDAIVEKGLRPGLANDAAAKSANNWNSVCLGGLSLGALAVAERAPDIANDILAKAKANNFRGLKTYAPEGVYPEGVMYWAYGTMYQAMLIAGLQSALGTDWNLSKSPGFLESAEARNQQIGPTGRSFNFSDNAERPGGEPPAAWWYARTLGRPDLLREDIVWLKDYAQDSRPPQTEGEANRLLPLAAVWWPETFATAGAAPARYWLGRGINTLATFRSGWDAPKSMWLALKAGGASLSHAHMDAGSFVFEANGVRWASDLEKQDYDSLTSKGVDLWNGRQDSSRWGVFRLGPFSHNTLTINRQRHQADGFASVTHFEGKEDGAEKANTGAIVDLSPVFKTQASRVTRGFAFRPGSHVIIRDEIEGLKPGDRVRWAMLTYATVDLSGGSVPDAANRAPEAILSLGGRKLRVSLQSPVGTRWEVSPADPPPGALDAPNPGARLLIAHLTAPASGSLAFSILLQPLSPTEPTDRPVPVPADPLRIVELSRWPQPSVAA